jgi:pyridoxamine 5'-phosphate oxidase-like protein
VNRSVAQAGAVASGGVKVIRDRHRSLDVDELLSRPLFAHLATASDEGPRNSPVWFSWENGAVWIIASRTSDTFPARLEREPRCAIGVVAFDCRSGLVQHVGMRGRATVERFDTDRAHRLLERYLGSDDEVWDPRFRATLVSPVAEQAVLVRFVPETVVARDLSFVRDAGDLTV